MAVSLSRDIITSFWLHKWPRTPKSEPGRAGLRIRIFGSNFWDPHWKQNSNSVFDSGDSGWIFFWKLDVWKVRNLEFIFAKFGIRVICLRRNLLRLIVANLYWLQSMYNDLILIVHKLAAPLQHQTADLGSTTSCYLMASSMQVMSMACCPW